MRNVKKPNERLSLPPECHSFQQTSNKARNNTFKSRIKAAEEIKV